LLNYALPTGSQEEADRAALAILDAPWVSFMLTSLTLSLIAGVVLWLAGMVTLAFRDRRPFALFVLVVVLLILLLFFVGLTQMS
jgi:hypothetical protein